MTDQETEKKGTAIVTGGAKGIGKAISENLLRAGYAVVIFDNDPEGGRKTAAELSLLGRTDFIEVDVGSEESVSGGFLKVRADHPVIDAVVNNAGISGQFGDPIGSLDLGDWNRTLAVNLTSIVLTTRNALPVFRGGRGAIVNISSTRFLQSEKNTFAYTASKGGIVSLTHALGVSLGPDIRVNCISPGWIDTRAEPLRREDHEQHPAGRVGKPEDVAALAVFLLSEEAAFITGQNFIVDGGMTRKMIYNDL